MENHSLQFLSDRTGYIRYSVKDGSRGLLREWKSLLEESEADGRDVNRHYTGAVCEGGK